MRLLRLNLLPKTLRRRVEPGWWKLVALLFLLAALGINGAIYYTALTDLRHTQERKALLETEVRALAPYVAKRRALEEERSQVEALLTALRPLEEARVPVGRALGELVSALPLELGKRRVLGLVRMEVRALSEEERRKLLEERRYGDLEPLVEAQVQGEAEGMLALVRMVAAFEGRKGTGISFGEASRDQAGAFSFQASLAWGKEGAGAEAP